MAGVHQYGWKVIPAVRSGYGADTLPDQCRSEGKSADKPIQQCTALAVEEHKVLFPRQMAPKGFFPRHYVCLRLTVNTVITECAPLIQYTAGTILPVWIFWTAWHFFHHPRIGESSNSLLFLCLTTRCSGSGILNFGHLSIGNMLTLEQHRFPMKKEISAQSLNANPLN